MSSDNPPPSAKNTRQRVLLSLLTFCGVLAALLVYVEWKFDLNEPPSTSGDEIEYDSIAWELSQGRGYAIDVQDEEFREPYDRFAELDPERWRLRGPVAGTVVNRPPLYPFLASIVNRALGRQFWGIRVLNLVAMAAIAALLAGFVVSRWKCYTVAASLVLFLAIDVRTRLYGRAILTEALSALLVAILFWALLELPKSRHQRFAWLSGVVFGLAILSRTMFIFWTPFVLWLVWRAGRQPGTGSNSAKLVMAFLIAAGAVITPWAIRNCVVTGRFLPLGTQGQVELAAGFSDFAWESRGVWVNLESHHFYDELDLAGKSSVEQQLLKGDFSQRHAVDWVKANPGRTIALGGLKIGQELRPRSITEGILLLLAISGWFALRSEPERIVIGGLLLANLVAIAVTWSVEGRFMVSLMFLQHILAAAAIAKVFNWKQTTPTRDVSLAPKE